MYGSCIQCNHKAGSEGGRESYNTRCYYWRNDEWIAGIPGKVRRGRWPTKAGAEPIGGGRRSFKHGGLIRGMYAYLELKIRHKVLKKG